MSEESPKHQAQKIIVEAIVNEISRFREADRDEVADEIGRQGVRVAKMFGYVVVTGLDEYWPEEKQRPTGPVPDEIKMMDVTGMFQEMNTISERKVRRMFAREGIITVGHLLQRSRDDLRRLGNFGPTALKVIERKLSEHNLELGMIEGERS